MKNTLWFKLAFIFIITIIIPAQLSSLEKINLTQYVQLNNTNVVGITVSGGVVISTDNGKNWTQRNNKLPFKVVYPFADDEYRRLTSLFVDPVDTNRIAITDSSSIFLTTDGGWNWEEVKTGGPVKRSNYFTSISLDPKNTDRIILGTSFNGIFETKNYGKTWNKVELDLGILYRGAGFYEEISGLGIDPYDSNKIYIAAGFSHDIFTGNYLDKKLTLLESSALLPKETILGFDIKKDGIGVYLDKSYYFKENGSDIWKSTTALFADKENNLNTEDLDRLSSSAGRTGIYVNSFHGSGERLEAHFTFMKENGYNSMVIDMKDDEGKLTYNTELELPLEIGAVRNRFDLKLLLEKAKENNIYVIGRIVVFKDPMLYRYSNSAYAI
ncbi:MAG: putative glycoside hydrolase, partial [Spirochaetota bacterium]|nr:putative glycoside hydrolase [Spirochaetota bacterium]